MRRLRVERDMFDIAIICALRIESDAVEAAFDRFFEGYELLFDAKPAGDPNSYTFGKIAQHHVILAYMPRMGKANAARVSAHLCGSFPNIRLGLVVGICGAVPQPPENEEIFLGDIIISTGVVQVDFGRQYTSQFVRKDTIQDNLPRPNIEICGFYHRLRGLRGQRKFRQNFSQNVTDICGKEEFASWTRPTPKSDKLYRANYGHMHRDPKACSVCAQAGEGDPVVCESALAMSCERLGCDEDQTIARERKPNNAPAVHFGGVASSDQVMKSALNRDRIANQENIVGFEMEGAGVWDSFPTVIIKGACDYADCHKNKKWQKYASVTAAAGAMAFLQQWEVTNHNTSRTTERRQFEPVAGNDIVSYRCCMPLIVSNTLETGSALCYV